MQVVRGLVLTVVLLVAIVLQVSFFGYFSFDGVVPNLVLLLVVAAALTRGPELAVMLGFLGGLAADLLPPAQHVAGRWALALVVVGYLAGRVRADAARSTLGMLVTVAAGSFIGTSIFALAGILTRDPAVSALAAVQVIPQALLYDLTLAPFVLPVAMRMFRRLEPERPERVAVA
jgi:rod shape-determining protein MreD